MKFSGLDITLFIFFAANVVIGVLLKNISSALGWGVATMWFYRSLKLTDALGGKSE